MNYYKQRDSNNISRIPAYHKGEGTFDVCQLFEDEFRMPIKVAIWELGPGPASLRQHAMDKKRGKINVSHVPPVFPRAME